ncbi:PEPxxWA-CTERM sorting domain-containing protein [Sphingomonas sp. ID0503]|uniref:PEPxxWA-CTERM sorting domain-containing protein n=1 Tax=Sphingomonas sp. ID0503 TaxID=3399691 RepID=UPI003AFB4D1D
MRNLTLIATGLAGALVSSSPAFAATLFQFDAAASSISVVENGRICAPSAGCALSASLLLPFADLSIDEGASKTFDFAEFNVSAGFGSDLNARIDAVLAFTSPIVDAASSGATASYLRLGGFFTPGVVKGAVVWDNPVQSLTAADGTKFNVTFSNLAGVTFGSNAIAKVTIGVQKAGNAVTPAVPEPASWAMMIAGFGLVGGASRVSRRRVVLAA